MNATLSTRQLRLVVILGMLVLLVGGFLVVERGRSTKSSTPPATSTPAVSTPAQTTSTPSTTHKATPTALKTHGLPVPVARALQKHSVVVVSLTTPRGSEDQFLAAEAKAGAVEAHAGYVAIDVFHQRPGTTILRKLGVTDTPVTLVVKRSGAIVQQFPGFVDRDVVAQAATEAR